MSERQRTELTIRTYHGEEDIPAIVALYHAAAKVDGPEFGSSEEEMRLDLSGPHVMPRENAFLASINGDLVAYGRTQLEKGLEESIFELWGIVHPDWRRRGIGTRLMERIEQRIQEYLGEATSQSVYIGIGIDLKHEGRQALFRKLGYKQARYFFQMECCLQADGRLVSLPEPIYPPGIVVQSMAERPDLCAVRKTFDAAFREHWGYTESTYEEWVHWTEDDPHYRAERWLVAWDVVKDAAAGICINVVEPEHNERVGRQESWVNALAVRRPYRRQGLGSALLLTGMRVLQEAGMEWAMLGVDAENLTGALHLYEHVGFRPAKKNIVLRKALRL